MGDSATFQPGNPSPAGFSAFRSPAIATRLGADIPALADLAAPQPALPVNDFAPSSPGARSQLGLPVQGLDTPTPPAPTSPTSPPAAPPDSPPAAPPVNGSQASATYKGAFDPFQVTPGVTVDSHLGAHWGPGASYTDDAKIGAVADQMKQMGVGYSTVIVDSANPGGMDKVIDALKARGIEPVVRLIPQGDYNKPLNAYTDQDKASFASAVGHLNAKGVKMVQLDNEPNLAGLPKDGPGFDRTMQQYVKNGVDLLNLVHQHAPGMAVGLPPMAELEDPGYEKKFFTAMIQGFGAADKASGGQLLNDTFLGVHPYTIGQPGQGAVSEDWYRQTATAATGRSLSTLATEGGNPRNGKQGVESWQIQQADLKAMAQNPGDTQCLWLIAAGYLDGTSGGEWEKDALIHADGRVDPTVQHLKDIYAGREA